jgi:hypothetical protein
MTSLLAIRSIFKLGVGVLMLMLVTACDDAPETHFEIREDGKTVTLPDADKDRILALGAGLCDIDNVAGEADKKLINALSEMGYTNVSIKITRGQDGRNPKQEIRFSWKDKNQQTSCTSRTF